MTDAEFRAEIDRLVTLWQFNEIVTANDLEFDGGMTSVADRPLWSGCARSAADLPEQGIALTGLDVSTPSRPLVAAFCRGGLLNPTTNTARRANDGQ